MIGVPGESPNIIRDILKSNIKDSRGKSLSWSRFDRWYSNDPDMENPSGRHYIFMLRPDLYLVDDDSVKSGSIVLSSRQKKDKTDHYGSGAAEDPYFNYLAIYHPEIIASLTSDFAGLISGNSAAEAGLAAASGSGYGNSRVMTSTSLNSPVGNIPLTIHTFIPIITSRVESLQLPDYSLKTNAVVQPYTKYTIPYGMSGLESTTGGTFSINFREDRFYSMHKLFYGWAYYINNVMRNIMQPKLKYSQYGALDYATSIYDFLVDETGENVIYWAKYTGCFPSEVPLSGLGFNKGGAGEKECSVTFNYFMCEQMDTNILRDFQYNSLGHIAMKRLGINQFNPVKYDEMSHEYAGCLHLYDNELYTIGGNYSSRPIIYLDNQNIKLKWLS